jgi:bifunctional aspartokinase / homoserine dehydrogenase 1
MTMKQEQQEASHNAEGELGPYERIGLERVFTLRAECPEQENVIAFKFGGSSLLGAERLLHSARLVQEQSETRPVVAVVSAMKGVTDRLLHVGHALGQGQNRRAGKEAEAIAELHRATLAELQLEPVEHERVEEELALLTDDLLHEVPLRGRVQVTGDLLDRLASFGERYAARLFAAALSKIGVTAVPVASSDFVLTCDTFRNAKPHLEHTRTRGREILLPLLEAGIVPVVTGFIGATQDGRITTMGRNSSDFSGALIAHVVDAEELVIWTDVDGIYTANPHESEEAKLLHELSYDEAHALAASGAKVLHPHVLPLAAQTELTIWVRNTFKPEARGTRIAAQEKGGLA